MSPSATRYVRMLAYMEPPSVGSQSGRAGPVTRPWRPYAQRGRSVKPAGRARPQRRLDAAQDAVDGLGLVVVEPALQRSVVDGDRLGAQRGELAQAGGQVAALAPRLELG